MKVIKADIIGHFKDSNKESNTRHSIYSLDFQPNNTRLATAGGDKTVKLWKVDKLLQSPDEAKDSLLATLTCHEKSINCVRWSHDGKYLASGSDDTYIVIYKFTPNRMSTQSFGSKKAPDKEVWSRCCTLRGHTMDVLDIDWSIRGLIASGSVDNRILIWKPNLENGNNPVISSLKEFKAHQSIVRGVSFDPAGKYLTSAGADNLLIVWDMDTFRETKRIKTLHKGSPDTTFFRRMSWNPDGTLFSVTSALKSCKPIGVVVKRKYWDNTTDLVGHSTATSSSRFYHQMIYNPIDVECKAPISITEVIPSVPSASSNVTIIDDNVSQSEVVSDQQRRSSRMRGHKEVKVPNIVEDEHASESDDSSNSSDESIRFGKSSIRMSSIVALGDQNGILSIWASHSKKALLVLKHILNGPITDISWMKSATYDPSITILACCGLDGTVVLVKLENEIIVDKVNEQDMEKHILKLYGRSLNDMQQCSIEDNVESVGNESSQSNESLSVTVVDSTLTSIQSTTANIIAHQVQSRTISGKKRIQPVLVEDSGNIITSVPSVEANQHSNLQVNELQARQKKPRAVDSIALPNMNVTKRSNDTQSSFAQNKLVQMKRVATNDPVFLRILRHCEISQQLCYLSNDFKNQISHIFLVENNPLKPYSLEVVNSNGKSKVSIRSQPSNGLVLSNDFPDDISTICGCMESNDLENNAFAFYGTNKGTICILSLKSLKPLYFPFVLGSSIAFIDSICYKADQSIDSSKGVITKFMAMNSDGNVQVWEIHEAKVICCIETTIHPVVSSNAGFHVKSAYLSDRGYLILELSSNFDFIKQFSFDFNAKCWIENINFKQQ